MTTNKTPIEHYVKGFIQTQRISILSRRIIQKAIILIDKKLNNPCCTDPTAVIDLLTTENSRFINTIEKLLEMMQKHGNTQSLQRTKALLERRLDCCVTPIDLGEPDDFSVSMENVDAYKDAHVDIFNGEDAATAVAIGSADSSNNFHEDVVAQYNSPYVRLEVFSDATTPHTDFAINEEDPNNGWVDTTNTWTINGSIAEKTFTGDIPAILVFYDYVAG
jgi:hypothetical protein